MGVTLWIGVKCEDQSDFDWLRMRVLSAVEEVVDEQSDRLDDNVTIDWDVEDT